MRVGIGYDIHRLSAGRDLMLGGVKIGHPKGLAGHSDADVVIHAVADALLGAAGMGDIGEHFPDTDPSYANLPGSALLADVVRMVATSGLAVGYVDIIIIAEEPKLGPYKLAMRTALAKLLGVEPSEVNIKAKTAEGLGPIGEKLAIAAWASATVLEQRD